ncbi:MAG: TIGR02266 family protein [Deltaproteobacteria bacterium]|nr:TIGR02266 family protein [Deltaproteobacteria bacterium]
MFTLASEETYQDGQTIIKEGRPGDWVYVVLSGSVEISKTIGGKRHVIELLKEGEVFGEVGFLGGMKRTASAVAVGETHVGVIERASLDGEYNTLSSEFRTIIQAMARRFEKVIERISDLSQRTEPRYPKTLSLAYKDRDSFLKAYSSNISKGGLFIRAEKPMEKGERFVLKLQLPDPGEPLTILCEVAWARAGEGGTPAGMGVKFVEVSAEDQQTMKRYVETLRRKT